MSKNEKKYLDTVETFIGPGTVFKGTVVSDKTIRIDGKLIGDVEKSEGVVIGEKAKIEGNINTKYIIVAGKVEGNIVATEGIELLDKSVIVGNIQTTILSVNEGAVFDGNSSMIKAAETSANDNKKDSEDKKNSEQKK